MTDKTGVNAAGAFRGSVGIDIMVKIDIRRVPLDASRLMFRSNRVAKVGPATTNVRAEDGSYVQEMFGGVPAWKVAGTLFVADEQVALSVKVITPEAPVIVGDADYGFSGAVDGYYYSPTSNEARLSVKTYAPLVPVEDYEVPVEVPDEEGDEEGDDIIEVPDEG